MPALSLNCLLVSMALFLAINTSGVAVLPLGVVAIRASLESSNAAAIIVPTLLATMCSTVVGVLVAKALARRPSFAVERFDDEADEVKLVHGSGPEITMTATEIVLTCGASEIKISNENISLNNGLIKVGLAGVSLVNGSMTFGVPP